MVACPVTLIRTKLWRLERVVTAVFVARWPCTSQRAILDLALLEAIHVVRVVAVNLLAFNVVLVLGCSLQLMLGPRRALREVKLFGRFLR